MEDNYIKETTELGTEAIEEIKFNRQTVLDGNLLTIPFPLPGLMRALPGVEKATYYITTANSKVGKTKIADYLFMYSVVLWYMNNPNRGIIHFLYKYNIKENISLIFSLLLCSRVK